MARILELEDDIHTISDKVLMKEVELDRYGHLPEAFTPSLFRWAYLLCDLLVSLALHNLIQGILVMRGFFLPVLYLSLLMLFCFSSSERSVVLIIWQS